MKKILFIVILVTLFVSFNICFLTAEQDKTKMKTMMCKEGMMKKGKMTQKCPMHSKIMKKMMSKSIVATKDGGVVVMVGNKLLKYDKNLNLKNEAEIKIDMKTMHKKMMKMKKKCPVCGAMIEKSDKTMEKSGSSPEPVKKPGY